MVRSFVEKYLIREYYAIEVNILDDGEEYNFVHIKRNGSVLNIFEQSSIQNFETLLQQLKTSIPLVISFTGKKVINKCVLKQPNYLETILFNKNPDDFYIYEYFSENNFLVSVARKDIIDFYLDRFQKSKFSIIEFTIGSFVLEYLRPFLTNVNLIKTKNLTYSFDSFTLDFLTNPSESLGEYTIGDEKLSGNFCTAFASFLAFFNKGDISTNFEPLSNSIREETSYKRAFNVYGAGILGLFLLLLSISYVVQSIYANKSAGIQQELSIKNQQLDQIGVLTKDRVYKQSIIENSSLANNQFLSFYISTIAKDLPVEIGIEEINLFPIEGQINKTEKIKIIPKLITIKGITNSKFSVNNWVATLDSYEWIKKTELSNYLFVKNEYVFTLNLFL